MKSKEIKSAQAVRAPQNAESIADGIFPEERFFFSPEVFHHKDVLVTGSGICFNRFLQLLPGSHSNEGWVKQSQQKIAVYNFFRRKKIKLPSDQTFLVIHNQWYSGYYHWMIDSMSRLMCVKERLDEVCLLLPEKSKQFPYIKDSLAFFPELSVFYLPDSNVARVDNLLLPSHLPSSGMFVPELVFEFKKRVLAGLDCKAEKRERLYITRKKASRRKVLNEDEVLDVLEKYGFKTIVLEDYSFSDQAQLFRHAEFVVSIHGAGLTNIIFMEKGQHVIEIFKQPYNGQKYVLDYHMLSSVFDLNYYALLGIPQDETASFDEASLQVNVRELDNLLSGILKNN